MSDRYQQFIGKDADVISGPHEGRGGRILQIRDVALDGRDPEAYAVIEFQEQDCFKDWHTDHVAVPVRRVSLRRP